jgi:hypothetical protein
MKGLPVSRNHELNGVAGTVVAMMLTFFFKWWSALQQISTHWRGRLSLIPQPCKIRNYLLRHHSSLRFYQQPVHQISHMPFQLCGRKNRAVLAFL